MRSSASDQSTSKKALTERFVREERAWRARGALAVLMHPGFVKTALNGGQGDLTPVQSARGFKRVLEGATAADAGKFFAYDGKTLSLE